MSAYFGPFGCGNIHLIYAFVSLEAMTRREQSLALFHMIGKVFYNKSKIFIICTNNDVISSNSVPLLM